MSKSLNEYWQQTKKLTEAALEETNVLTRLNKLADKAVNFGGLLGQLPPRRLAAIVFSATTIVIDALILPFPKNILLAPLIGLLGGSAGVLFLPKSKSERLDELEERYKRLKHEGEDELADAVAESYRKELTDGKGKPRDHSGTQQPRLPTQETKQLPPQEQL